MLSSVDHLHLASIITVNYSINEHTVTFSLHINKRNECVEHLSVQHKLGGQMISWETGLMLPSSAEWRMSLTLFTSLLEFQLTSKGKCKC